MSYVQLSKAADKMEISLKDNIIKMLKEKGFLDEKKSRELGEKLKDEKGASLINVLSEGTIASEMELLMVLSHATGLPPLDIARFNLNKEMMNIVPAKILKHHLLVPISRIENDITVAICDPTDVFALDDIKALTSCQVHPIIASKRAVEKALSSFFDTNADEDISTVVEEGEAETDVEVVGKAEGIDVTEVTKESTTAPIVKMVDLIITEALKKRASDIHIEPQEKTLKIRYRIDGEMYKVFDLPKSNQNAILARIKIMSTLDITETRVPQDGRFRIRMENKEVDFRVSSLPTIYGNKIVLRALDKSNLSIGLENLGFLPEPLEDFKKALARPFGIILVTGPTGSGKSTTLYSVLNEMNVPERNILTIEDPVEYQVEGITQIAAKSDIGLDFANGLRAILRQSPDIIMVGEIRDFETADIAIKASLTGQMVLSTLHTNDSVGAITRLVNMGIEPFLVASSLVLACAQRLLRKICDFCREETDIPRKVIEELSVKYPEIQGVDKFYKGKGCPKCNNTGYRGRFASLETLLMDNEVKDMVNRKVSENEIRAYLAAKKVSTLRENSIRKFIKGVTTLEEVYRST